MTPRTRLELVVAGLVVLVGFLIGGMWALLTRPSSEQTTRVIVATTPVRSIASPRAPRRTLAPAPTATPAAARTPAPIATGTPAATPIATATPTPTTRIVATPTGVWRIEEANTDVGTIVWSGAGAKAGSNTIVLDLHKEAVAGHAVSACERHTVLHATIAGAVAQTVPYREVNCSGATTSGEMRVTSFSNDGRSFSGNFWSGGTKLGDFTAASGT